MFVQNQQGTLWKQKFQQSFVEDISLKTKQRNNFLNKISV